MNDISPAAGPAAHRSAPAPRWQDVSAYVLGSFGGHMQGEDGNRQYSGAGGLLFRMNDDLVIGIGVQGGRSNAELYLDGDNRLISTGGNILAAWEPGDSGPRLYGTVSAAHLDSKIRRVYMNGAGTDASLGDTTGFAYGAAVMGGWSFDVNDGKTSVMPYGRLDVSRYHLDGYTERGGAFPATVRDEKSTQAAARLGVELTQEISPAAEWRGRVAWGHRLSDTSRFSATSGIATVGVPDARDDRDWAEAGLTGAWQVSEDVYFLADITGRTGEGAEPQAAVTFGIKIGF